MRIVALYDIHGNVDALDAVLAAGSPDTGSIAAALIEPVDPLIVTQAFEELARGEREP